MMTKTTIIATKMARRVVSLSSVLVVISADAQVAGEAGQVGGVTGQVEGCCVTITPV